MDIDEIRALLPHRPPFLLVDRLDEVVPGERAVGVKQVTHDEFWVPAHFPGDPIMPGVLITEAMAQVAALVFLSEAREQAGAAVYLVGLDKVRFRKPVRPGDALRIAVEVTDRRRRMWTFSAEATVDGARVANGSLLATVGAPDRPSGSDRAGSTSLT